MGVTEMADAELWAQAVASNGEAFGQLTPARSTTTASPQRGAADRQWWGVGIDSDTSDAELWALAAGGSAAAFAQLFDRHAAGVYNHCFRLTGSWAEAEDLTSTVFLQAWRRRAEVRVTGGGVRPWLLAVAGNTARTERRSLARRLRLAARVGPPPAAADHADDVAERVDDERRMAAVLAAAPPAAAGRARGAPAVRVGRGPVRGGGRGPRRRGRLGAGPGVPGPVPAGPAAGRTRARVRADRGGVPMTEPSLLPPRRELPAPTADRIRARVLAGTTAPAGRRSRWLPLAAAAAVVVLVAGAVAVTGARDDRSAPPAGPPSPSPSGPDRAALLADCVKVFGTVRDRQGRIDRSPFGVRALFRDRDGYMLWAGSTTMTVTCSFTSAGALLPSAGGGADPSGYLVGDAEAVVVNGYGTQHVTARDDRLGYHVTGRVRRDVARVVVTWPDAEPVTAALEGPYFAARATYPGRTDVDRPALIVAYTADGTQIDTAWTAR